MIEDGTLFQVDRPTYRLARLEVYNWGPFAGLHRAEIDPGGTAMIGRTGSGKTTLIDAYVTLLAERPKYNLASTGGHESDRDLVSYVRGVIGSGGEIGDTTNVSRKGKTLTGICATYTNGEETLRLGALFWIDGTGSSAADLKRAWLFARGDGTGLEHWLTLHHEGGLRALKKQVADSDDLTQIYDASTGGKARFLARVRDYFEVSQNAFALLNRAAGLKQLNSIDEIFRELVLDDHSQFDRAAEVVGDFDRLTEIHEELLTAQRQERSLLPVQSGHKSLTACLDELTLKESLKQLLPVWVAENGHRLWKQLAGDLAQTRQAKSAALEKAETRTTELEQQKNTCHEAYLKTGGQDLEDLRERVKTARREHEKRQLARQDFRQVCANLEIDTPDADAGSFAQFQATVRERSEHTKQKKDEAQEHINSLGAARAKAQETHRELAELLEESRRRKDTNLPSRYLALREALAGQIGLDPGELPYVAELIEVKDEAADWRGAIERALGGHRLRLLVPQGKLQAALRWINRQDQFRLHIRCWEAQTEWSGPPEFLPDGYTRKLRFKTHPLRDALKHFLASHDLHCVDSPDALADTPHALTITGLTSGRRGYFEKKDQRPLHEDWLTGFDNRDRVAMLGRQLTGAKAELDAANRDYETATRSQGRLDAQAALLEQVARLEFEQIDVPGAQSQLSALETRFERLSRPDSDAGKAFQEYQIAEEKYKKAREGEKAATIALTEAETQLKSAEQQRDTLSERRGEGLTRQETELAREHLPWPPELRPQQLDGYERKQSQELENLIHRLTEKRSEITGHLVRAMAHAKQHDTGALAEAGTELADIPAYIERLRVLKEEALPAKREKFQTYLNQSSDQGVTQLLVTITNEVEQIRERIAELNRSLQKIDFKQGRYLRLDVQDVTHESLRSLERALKRLRAAYLKREEDSEAHFRALQEVIRLVREATEKKHTRPARALLDPRYRVEFHGAEVERATGAVPSKFKGSQSGSGGEKEIIASYILSASLCYALSPGEGQPPLHATIVLDEAFSKSSRSVARRIIQALEVFQLHPIFVTPDKEMRLLREHTQSVINVHRVDAQATLTSIRWETLDQHAAAVQAKAVSSDG